MHDGLDRLQIKLFTFLVGQQDLLSIKTNLQRAKQTQIVARLMVEELAFAGIRSAQETATCLNGYDQTSFPRDTGCRSRGGAPSVEALSMVRLPLSRGIEARWAWEERIAAIYSACGVLIGSTAVMVVRTHPA